MKVTTDLQREVEKLCESVDHVNQSIHLLSLALFAADQILAKDQSEKSKELYAEVKVLRRNFYRTLERTVEEGRQIMPKPAPTGPQPRGPAETELN